MKFIADLHIHSHYSRATSRALIPEQLHHWAQLKGLGLIASGDITHPQWKAELQTKLQPAAEAPGFFRLRPDLLSAVEAQTPHSCRQPVFFILSGEISCIYKKGRRVRKIHLVVYLPSFAAVEKLQSALTRLGNIHSDGRPILGLDARDLLELVLQIDPAIHMVPAHIWTPWFSLLGSQSGFDSVEECFEDLTPHLFALETGLSSDPPMNWRLSMLDGYRLISNSDAHSPENLGREANLFDTDMNYDALFAALRDKNSTQFEGTIEFFPEEGKYHWDGHRKCRCVMHPSETAHHQGRCAVCGKPATLGVCYRVHQLADRPEGFKPKTAKPFFRLVPLPEVLSEVYGVGVKAKKVQQTYPRLLSALGPELEILMNISLADIEKTAGVLVAEAIRRMRAGEVATEPGYDGEYGIVHLFKDDERQKILQQSSLFPLPAPYPAKGEQTNKAVKETTHSLSAAVSTISNAELPLASSGLSGQTLNPDQQVAVRHRGAPLIIQAGPGAGKTLTLTQRLVDLIQTGDAQPEQILALAFTQKSAAEMRSRLILLTDQQSAEKISIHTFHSFGREVLRQASHPGGRTADFIIIDPEHDLLFQQQLQKKNNGPVERTILHRIALLKSLLYLPESLPKEFVETAPPSFIEIFQCYEQLLLQQNAFDFEDLIAWPVRLLRHDTALRRRLLQQYSVLAVDEFQDINPAQYELFRILAIAAKDVCVIGDPDQAIYGFRGASHEFFLRFQHDFPSARFIRLQQNYRCAPHISLGARQMLTAGQEGAREMLPAQPEAELTIQLHQAISDRAEADFVVSQIERLTGGISHFSIDSDRGRSAEQVLYTFSDFAILLRSRILMPPLLEALTRSGIPFRTATDEVFSGDPRGQFVLACLRFWHARVINFVDVQTIGSFFLRDDVKLFDHFLRQTEGLFLSPNREWQEIRQTVGSVLPPSSAELLNDLALLPKDTSLSEVIERIFTVFPRDDRSVGQLKRRLKSLAAPYQDRIQLFIHSLELQKEIDQLDSRADQVSVLTLHAAKGLEFTVVFIIGCEENILPFSLGALASDTEEERRLLYVGMTRARQRLYLSHAKFRFLRGQRHRQYPSRFLAAISETLLQKHQGKKTIHKNEGQLELF